MFYLQISFPESLAIEIWTVLKNNTHRETKNDYMYFADVYSAQYAPGRQTTVKLIREFNYCDLNRGKIFLILFLYSILISLVWIYWVALDETYFSEDFSFWRLRCTETDVCIQVILCHGLFYSFSLPRSDPGKYPPLTTDTKVNSCFSVKQNSEIIQHKKMILTTHLFLYWLQYF